MDESRPVEAGARHKVLRMTLLSEFQHTGRTIVVTTGIQKGSYAQSQDSFFFFPHPTLYPSFTKTPVKHFYQISVACNPDTGFLCQKSGTWLQL